MEDTILSRALRVRDKRAARVFSDPARRQLLLLFAGRERFLAEVADSAGLDLKRLHYDVTALRSLGLLSVTRRQKRAGRPIKFYRAVADAFFVSDEIDVSPPHVRLTADLRASLNKLRDPSREGVLYHTDENGRPRMRVVQAPPSTRRPCVEMWRLMRLTPDAALRLAADVEKCFKTYAPPDGAVAGADTYLLHFAFAPNLTPETKARRR